MASAKQFEALLASHIEGDEEQLLSVALQVAAAESRQGRQESADSLKRLVQRARDRKRGPLAKASPIPLARPKGELQDLVGSSYPDIRLGDMVLSDSVRDNLEDVLTEQRQRALLRDHDERPLSRLLLVGPPGTGKTMTASALAGELHLPLFTIRLDALFTRYLGETASKLRLIFDQAASTRAIYFFDEFDAVGGRRSESTDVGEMRRVLNSFLQFLEEPNATDSVIVAATNHSEILDYALARRFDMAIEYGMPDRDQALEVLKRRLARLGASITDWAPVAQAALGLSQAEICLATGQVVKQAILKQTTVDEKRLVRHLQARHSVRNRFAR